MLALVANKRVMIEKQGGEFDYRRNIRGAVRGLWGGTIDIFGFLESMNRTIQRGFTMAWYEGAQAVGINSDELTDDEKNALYSEINGELSHTLGLAYAIMQESKANGGKLTPLMQRADMWNARYSYIVSRAMSMAGRDRKLRWVWNPHKEHCSHCRILHGRIYRASVWARYDIRPRMRRLACGGWRCGCSFEPTSDRATPGRPPSI